MSASPASIDLVSFETLPAIFALPEVRTDADFVRSINSGNYKRAIATSIHDQIVNKIATTLQDRGAEVFQDKRSVDLLAIFPDGKEEIYEIKTTNSSNLSHQLRSGFAQVLEYSYRREKHQGVTPSCFLAIDRPTIGDWQKEFMGNYGVELIALGEDGPI